jgi:hypothetical protein
MALALRRAYRQQATAPAGTDAPAPRPPRTRVAAARGAWAIGTVMIAIARLVRLAVGIAVGLIVAAIILRLVSANPGNVIVRDIHDAGRALVGPFNNVFQVKNPNGAIAANWGLAAIVWLVVGGFIASLIARAAPRGVHPARPVA